MLARSIPRWHYVTMTGPYVIVRCDDNDDATLRAHSTHGHLAPAIAEFADLHHPRIGQGCLLYDGNNQVLLGWTDRGEGEFDLRFQWWGCKMAFDVLAVFNPVDAAVWERLAYEGVH